DGHRLLAAGSYLRRPLDVDGQEHAEALVAGLIHCGLRRAVIVAVHLRPLQEPTHGDLVEEALAVPEEIVHAVPFAGPGLARRCGYGRPQPLELLQQPGHHRRLADATRARQDDERSAFHRRSLYVLDQLADLLQGALHLDHVLGDLDVAGLRADGV